VTLTTKKRKKSS